MDLNNIVSQFFPNAIVKSINIFGNGHINSTYKVEFKECEQEYILQKLNTNVFTQPYNLVENHLKIQEYLHQKNQDIEIPKLIKATSDSFLYKDDKGSVWRMMNFIKDSYSVEVVESKNQAHEAGKGFGWFLLSCSELNSSEFHEAIKDFHKLSFRLNQFNKAIKLDKANRCALVQDIIEFYQNRASTLLQIEDLINADEIPVRVVHNDTKINNLLFRNDKTIAVIDLDTVGPGVVFNDYGDALRTITNTSSEDEKEIDLVKFNVDAFEAFSKGYLQQIKSILVPKEKELLYKSPILMTYIMGIRFLTDYLNGDIYYKTKYQEHNLVRSKVQKRLIEQMEIEENKMIEIINIHIN